MKSSVFRRSLKVLSIAAFVIETGRLFHTRAAATGKARSPTVEKQVGGMTRVLVVANQSLPCVKTWKKLQFVGNVWWIGCAKPWTQRFTSRASFYSIHCSIFNQCSRCRSGDTRWCFWEENIRHSATFRTDCSQLMVLAGRLGGVEQP